MKNRERAGWSWPQWFVVVLASALGGFVAMALVGTVGTHSPITTSIANCRQVILAIRLYASDHNGEYPDAVLPGAKTSNQVFHQLIVAGALEDEKIFGCPVSPFVPDGNIGTAPGFEEAVKPGENHWALTKRLNESAPGEIPLVYENPASAGWPPTWDASLAGKARKGRTWSGGRIVIGLNDSSVELRYLNPPSAPSGSSKHSTRAKELFGAAIDPVHFPKGEILDVAVK